MALAKGDVVIIKGEERNRGLWKLGIVEELTTGLQVALSKNIGLNMGTIF